jgi:NAD(P)-dependent dehydrogenase (short-subunit alcohol dehydrogenase family)
MTGRLEGKRAIVTGAASGMGRSMALRFAREGARVLAADCAQAGLDSLLAEAKAERLAIEIHAIDLVEADAIPPMVERAVAQWSGLDILVNNAGIMDRFEGVGSLSLDIWRRVMATNLEAPMLAMRAAIPTMQAQGSGAILNISSVAGLGGATAGAAYTSAKHGLIGLTRNTAWIYGQQGIRCNAILPGAVNTGIQATFEGVELDPLGRARASTYFAICPGRLEPEDIAQTALFLVSDEARNVNGVLLPVDAGWLAA